MGWRSAAIPKKAARWRSRSGSTLTQAGVTIDRDALSWLSAQLGADRAATRPELEKLALYAGPGGRVDLDAAMACVGDLSGLSLDDALFAATAGDVAMTDRALELAIAEGAAPVRCCGPRSCICSACIGCGWRSMLACLQPRRRSRLGLRCSSAGRALSRRLWVCGRPAG